jgi:hypothetical protein
MSANTWEAHPQQARWYGEVIGSLPGEDITYVYGYSADEDEPDIEELIPAGWEVAETSLKPTPRNLAWTPVIAGGFW